MRVSIVYIPGTFMISTHTSTDNTWYEIGTDVDNGNGTGTITNESGSLIFTINYTNGDLKINSASTIEEAEISEVRVDDVSIALTSDISETLFTVKASSQGTWGDNIYIGIRHLEEELRKNPQDQSDDYYTFELNVFEKRFSSYVEVESWTVSRREDAIDGFGKSLFIDDVINENSSYIKVTDNNASMPSDRYPGPVGYNSDGTLSDNGGRLQALDGGHNGSGNVSYGSSTSDYGWGLYKNPEDVNVSTLISSNDTASVQKAIVDIAEARGDCIAILNAEEDGRSTTGQSYSQAATEYRRSTKLSINSSYAALYSPWIEHLDDRTGNKVFIPPAGYVAAIYARNDQVTSVSNAPAGPRRGVLPGSAVGLKVIYNEGDAATLNRNQVNAIRSFPGQGIQVYGNKTLQYAASALQSVNVRRNLNVLEKAMGVGLRQFVFENNTEFTRLQVTEVLESYLQLRKDEGDLIDFRVLCDETNNTGQVIDSGELRVDVYLKPPRSAEFVVLRAVVLSSGASFEEIIDSGTF